MTARTAFRTFFVIVLLLGLMYGLSRMNEPSLSKPGACTLEAKICPDGSTVGRMPPTCEFAPCPETTTWSTDEQMTGTVTTWTTTTDETISWVMSSWTRLTGEQGGVVFHYPEQLPTRYISTQERPPLLNIRLGQQVCAGEIRTIDAQDYCVQRSVEWAAGSMYTTYVYSRFFSDQDQTVMITFTLREVQCSNYDSLEKTACKQERDIFQPDALISVMFESMRFEG